MVLTSGRPNPNDRGGASGELIDEMIRKIKSLGTIKEIVKNPDLVKSIIAYNGDRHFFATFIEMINNALKTREIYPEDLEVFNSGEIADAIVNIKRTVQEYGKREPYKAEIWDKLNYLALLQDANSMTASFTHPLILDALCEGGNHELTEWTNTQLPTGSVSTIASEMLQRGYATEALKFLNKQASYSLKYSSANKEYFENNKLM